MKRLSLLIAPATFLTTLALAQSPAATPAGPPMAPAPVSPEVHPDRTVTFRTRAPGALSVTVTGEWLPPVTPTASLAKDASGVWSVTLGPLPPDLYGYSFNVDGFKSLDPGNSAVKPMRSPTTSILEDPGDRPMLHDFQSVPHGTVHLHEYFSKSLEKVRALCVYTPPGYDTSGRTRYPVLYLLHGSGDNEATWSTFGRAQFIVDNLLAQGRAKPMLVVMTDGHAVFTHPPATNTDARPLAMIAFERDLLEDAMPFVDANYRAKSGRENQGIIGLSMGGNQSLTIGLNHLDKFAWVGGMSAAVVPEAAMAGIVKDPKAAGKNLKLLWFACGTADGLLQNNQQLHEALVKYSVKHEFHPTDGNHSWPVWRRYLADFIPLVFASK